MITKLGRVGVIVLVIFGMLVIGGRTVLAANAGVTSIPSVQTVAAGANFSVDISVTTSTPTRGMQFALTSDPTKVKCNWCRKEPSIKVLHSRIAPLLRLFCQAPHCK